MGGARGSSFVSPPPHVEHFLYVSLRALVEVELLILSAAFSLFFVYGCIRIRMPYVNSCLVILIHSLYFHFTYHVGIIYTTITTSRLIIKRQGNISFKENSSYIH